MPPSSGSHLHQESQEGEGARVYCSGKGNQWFFGMKAHIGVEQASDLIHAVATTGAKSTM